MADRPGEADADVAGWGYGAVSGRYLFNAGMPRRRVMHIARYSPLGEMLDESFCGRRGFNRSINAPWGLGRRVCKHCTRKAFGPGGGTDG